jgi:hypothetical protein
MNFFKYLLSMLKEMVIFSWQKKVWWLVPLVIIFLAMGLLIVVGETSAPFIYTLF